MGKYYNIILFLLLYLLIIYDVVYDYLPHSFMIAIQIISLFWMLLALPKYIGRHHKSMLITSSLLLIVVMFFSFFLTRAEGTTFFKTCVFCSIVAIPFMSGNISPKEFKRFSIVLIILALLSFVVVSLRIRSDNELAYGGGYFPVVVLPLGLYLLRDKPNRYKLLFSIIVLFLVLFSAKRGDILACILAIVTYFLMLPRGWKSNTFLTNLISIIIVCVAIFILVNYLRNSSEVFKYKYEQTASGYSSGRDEIYTRVWEYYLTSPIEKKIFGYGFDGVPRLIGGRAHNDWLEIIIGEGIVGVLLYFLMLLSMVSLSFRRSVSKENRSLFVSILAIWVVKSVFSMFLFSMPTMVLFILIGYLLNPRTNNERY